MPETGFHYKPNLGADLWTLLQESGEEAVAVLATNERPQDLANALETLPQDKRQTLFDAFPPEIAAESLEEHAVEFRDELLASTSDTRLLQILHNAKADDAVYFLDHLDDERAESLLAQLQDDVQTQLTQQYELDDETAGHMMSRDLITFKPQTTVADIFAALRGRQEVMEGYVYVVDTRNCYLGRVGLRELVIADPNDTAKAIMRDSRLCVLLETDREEVADLMQVYHLRAVPVVDNHGRLCGQVTWDDAVDALEAEAEEDMLAIAGTRENLDDNDPPYKRAAQRLPYLTVTAIGGFIMAFFIHGSDEELTSRFPLLVAFLPLVPALGGNIGIQSATVTVRSIATGDLDIGRIWSRTMKELVTGILLAISLSLLCGLGAVAMCHFTGGPLALGGVITISLLVAILIAACFGVFIPLACQRFNIDPAIAAGPFITMLNDVTGVAIYLLLAGLLLSHI